MPVFFSIFSSVFFAGFLHAQGTWYYPDPRTVPTFNNIDVVNASWSVPATSSAFLWLWCTPTGTVAYTLEFNVSVPFDGYRLCTLNYGSDLYCHFVIGHIKTGNFHIEESDQLPITWAPLTDPSPTTSVTDARITTSSLRAPAASSSVTSSLNIAATTAKNLVSSDSSLRMAASLMSSSPSVFIATKSMNITTNTCVSTVSSSSLPLTSPQPANGATNLRTLSTGSKAGIVIAVVAVVVISAINILYCIRTRIKSSKLHSEPALATKDKKACTQWSSELQGSEFAVEKDASGSAREKNVWELQ